MSRKVFFSIVIMTCLWWLPADIVSATDGGTLFIHKCGSCHQQEGLAKPVNPADKAEVVWEKYFKRDRHPGKLSTIGTEDELTRILNYLKKHAADSDYPEAAAIPKG